MKKVVLILGILFLFAAANAQAGFNFGVKALSLSQTDPTRIISNAGENTTAVPILTSHTLGAYFGFDVSPQVVIFGGLDFYRSQVKRETTPPSGTITKYETSFTSFSPTVGVKFYFKPRTSGQITPYILGGIFKTFTSVTLDDPSYVITPQNKSYDEELAKKINSPIGFYPAFGVEYYLSNNFSLGGEFGIRFSMASATSSVTVNSQTTSRKLTDTFISHYFGITLNYRFGE